MTRRPLLRAALLALIMFLPLDRLRPLAFPR